MKALVLTTDAQLEARAAANWYEEAEAGLGVEFISEVDRVLGLLADAPGRYPVWRPGRPYRRALLRRFPYVIFFVDEPDHVLVLAIAHQKRKPGYWLRRGR